MLTIANRGVQNTRFLVLTPLAIMWSTNRHLGAACGPSENKRGCAIREERQTQFATIDESARDHPIFIADTFEACFGPGEPPPP